jgi:hypothetical protein
MLYILVYLYKTARVQQQLYSLPGCLLALGLLLLYCLLSTSSLTGLSPGFKLLAKFLYASFCH